MSDSFIQINQISKHFGNVKAVNDVSFQIKEGEFFSLLGPLQELVIKSIGLFLFTNVDVTFLFSEIFFFFFLLLNNV